VHRDVNKIGRIHPGGGWKTHGREHGQTAAHIRAKLGLDDIRPVADDHSRPAYSEALSDDKGTTCARFLTVPHSKTPLSHRKPTPDQRLP
jgi:hypothetical protein